MYASVRLYDCLICFTRSSNKQIYRQSKERNHSSNKTKQNKKNGRRFRSSKRKMQLGQSKEREKTNGVRSDFSTRKTDFLNVTY
jgi:hypothetical protein